MKRLSTLLTAAFISLAAIAQSAGDYVYTDNGRFKIKTHAQHARACQTHQQQG